MKDYLQTLLLAHPGHGNPEQAQTIWHYLTEPMHVLPALGLLVIAAWVLRSQLTGRSERHRHDDH